MSSECPDCGGSGEVPIANGQTSKWVDGRAEIVTSKPCEHPSHNTPEYWTIAVNDYFPAASRQLPHDVPPGVYRVVPVGAVDVHKWIDATNEVVVSGEICKCGAVRAAEGEQ